MKHFIFAGRYGDICHSLPSVYEYAQRTGTKPRFTAAAEFAGILDGCSYLEPHAAPVAWQKIQEVLRYARALFPLDEFTVMACYGHDYSPGYKCYSYLRDSWRLSGCPIAPERVPLVFDNRNKLREENLIKLHTRNCGKPFILVSTHGKSSPFSNSATLLADIQAARPDCDIVDISQARAERVYDLLGLFEKAVALVTIDTLHLHLSAAVPSLPVFAFICDGPTRWNRTDWRPQQVWRCTYSEFLDKRAEFKRALTTMQATPRIFHVWSCLAKVGEETQRRMKVAQVSWQQEAEWSGNWTIKEAKREDLPRVHEDGDLPFVRDLIEHAIAQGAKDNDIISLSNSDVGCVQGVTSQILDVVREHGCAYTHRHDLSRIDKIITSEADVGDRCSWYPGSDWFFMTVAWWKKHSAEFPDMVVGREFWDAVMRQLMKKYGTREIQKAVWHEKHVSLWEQPGNRQNLPGNVHNRQLAMRWFAENRSDDKDPYRTTWNIQPGVTRPLNPRAGVTQPTRTPNLVFPRRLEVFQHSVRRIQR